MTANTEHIFNTGARSRIDAAITASATSLTLIPGGVVNFLPGWSSGKEFYCTLVDASRNREIVKVTAISDHTFTIVRGQDSSTARAWPIGTMIAQRPVAANYDRFIQKTFRTVTYNPNGVVTGAWDGEKIYDSVSLTWWINISGTIWKALTASDPVGYIFSGFTTAYTQSTDQYNALADSWTNMTDMPSPARIDIGALSISAKGYSCGGNITPIAYLQDTDQYDPDTWASVTDMPSPGRRSPGATTISDKGYLFGGYNGSRFRDTDEYDPDTWTSKTDMLGSKRDSLRATTISDKGYVYGGFTGSAVQDTDEYDPDTWTAKTDMPSPGRYNFAASTIESKGYIYAGSATLQDTDEYDPDTWTSKTAMPSPGRREVGATTLFNKGYCIGGRDGSGVIDDVDEYDPDTWTSKNGALRSQRNINAVAI